MKHHPTARANLGSQGRAPYRWYRHLILDAVALVYGQGDLMHLASPLAATRRGIIAGGSAALLLAAQARAQSTHFSPLRAVSAPAKANTLDASLKALADQERFCGAIQIASADRVLFSRAYGLASREYGAANTTNTMFNLASAGKMFTSTIIAHLVEEGRVTYDDPVAKHLDSSWLAAPYASQVTIRHLLTHTGGIPEYFKPGGVYEQRSRRLMRTVDEYKSFLETTRLDFAPGAQWHYSNSGYVLLGAIIEKVTGAEYAQAINDVICNPLGLKRTGAYDLQDIIVDYAQGYTRVPTRPLPPPPGMTPPPGAAPGSPPPRPGFLESIERIGQTPPPPASAGLVWRNNFSRLAVRGGPSGGSMSTVGDMTRFLQALNGKLLKPKTFETASTVQAAPADWALGFMPMSGGIGHTGGFAGVSTCSVLYPDGSTLVILSNIDNGAYAAAFEVLKLARA